MKKTFPQFGELTGTDHQKGGSFLLFLKQNPEPPDSTPIDLEKLEEANKPPTPPASDTGLSGLVTHPAEIYIKTKTHFHELRPIPAKDVFCNIWLNSNKYVEEGKTYKIILHSDKNIIYLIDHKDKSFVASSIPLDMAKVLPPPTAEIYSGGRMSLTVNPKGQTKKFGYWNCSGYDLKSTVNNFKLLGTIELKSTIWATTEVPFDWKTINEKFLIHLYPFSSGTLSLFTREMSKELQKINGYQIASETSSGVLEVIMKSSFTVMEIVKKAAPAGTFEVPTGYTQKERLSKSWGKFDIRSNCP
jgi:hypothetical protein